MKKYNLCLYLPEYLIYQNFNINDLTICNLIKNYNYNFYIIDEMGQYIMKNLPNKDISNDYLIPCYYTIEAFDKINEKEFLHYLGNEDSNYRIIDEDEVIIRYSNEDMEFLRDYHQKNSLTLYKDYNNIKNLNKFITSLSKNSFINLTLTGGFLLEMIITKLTYYDTKNILPLILFFISSGCAITNILQTINNFQDMKTTNKKIKKLEKKISK